MDPRIREALWEAWGRVWQDSPEDYNRKEFDRHVANPAAVWDYDVLWLALKILARNTDENS